MGYNSKYLRKNSVKFSKGCHVLEFVDYHWIFEWKSSGGTSTACFEKLLQWLLILCPYKKSTTPLLEKTMRIDIWFIHLLNTLWCLRKRSNMWHTFYKCSCENGWRDIIQDNFYLLVCHFNCIEKTDEDKESKISSMLLFSFCVYH